MADPAAAVTLHVWRVPAADAAAAVVRSQLDLRRFRARADVAFAKMLGTASDAFLPSAVTPTRWAALVCWRAAPPAGTTPWWDAHATERATLRLRPVHARGTWDGQMPFDATGRAGARDGHGVVVVTRSTLRLRKAAAFYRAVPPVATQLRATPGCRAAFGIGEAPLVRQGTVSIWESDDAVGGFLRSSAHRSAVAATPHQRWYAEELFARFAIEAAEGCLDGQVLG